MAGIGSAKGREQVSRYKNAVMLPLQGSGAPTDGTSGTYAGAAGIGSVYINSATGIWYINKGTKASPSWKAITTA